MMILVSRILPHEVDGCGIRRKRKVNITSFIDATETTGYKSANCRGCSQRLAVSKLLTEIKQ